MVTKKACDKCGKDVPLDQYCRFQILIDGEELKGWDLHKKCRDALFLRMQTGNEGFWNWEGESEYFTQNVA